MLAGMICLSTEAARVPPGQEYTYKRCGNMALKLYVVKPDQWTENDSCPAIVFFHGGGWVAGSAKAFAEHGKYFASRGAVSVLVEYRLLKSKKSEELPTVCIQDARSAMRWVRKNAGMLGVNPDRIASAGGSAGGHLAAFVGMMDGMDDPQDDLSISPKSNAMLLFNPVFDNGPTGYAYQRVKERYNEFSPLHNISSDDPPAIVFLGDRDELIPVETVNEFKKQMNAAGVACEVMIFEGMPHGFFNYGKYDNKPYHETIRAGDRFLTELGWLPDPAASE
jgi:acetyl esterase/lipase